jgi:alpha-amylase
MGVMMQAFYWDCPRIEGIPFGWWAHLQTKVPELAGVGFTALWLPPANKAANNTSMGYDPYDFFDPEGFRGHLVRPKGRAHRSH